MKNLSKLLVALLVGLLIFGDINVKAQTSAENVQHFQNGSKWQLQNPPEMDLSLILYFHKGESVVDILITHLYTGRKSKDPCLYNIKGNLLTIYERDGEEVFKISWMNKNKVVLIQNGKKSFYAVSGSPDDTYLTDLMNFNGGGYNYSAPQYGQPANSQRTCPSCFGDRRCHVCGGSGTYSRYGYSHTCTACYGSGKCSICGGKGTY